MHEVVADAVLVAHFAFVCFVVGGLALIWLGAWYGWPWIRNIGFRRAHVAAIVFVAIESLLGFACPLTLWEDELRGTHQTRGFIAAWIHRVMFYELPEWFFTAAYVAFAAAVVVTYWRFPPRNAASERKAR